MLRISFGSAGRQLPNRQTENKICKNNGWNSKDTVKIPDTHYQAAIKVGI
jgi:hypothetical protein